MSKSVLEEIFGSKSVLGSLGDVPPKPPQVTEHKMSDGHIVVVRRKQGKLDQSSNPGSYPHSFN